jgi:transposase
MVVKSDNRKKQVLWCKERRYWTVHEHWSKLIFSDECQVVIGTNNRAYIWRKDGSKVNNPHLMCTPSKKKLSIMIWGCMCYRGMGTLAAVNGNINSQKYIDILEENLWPVIARHFPDDNYVYMDDNAPVHISHLLRNYIAENSIKTTTWPVQSPDINVIENIWLKIKRELENVCHRISTRDQLFDEIRRIWENISLELIFDLYGTKS